MAYTSERLITSVQRAQSVVNTQWRYSDQDILEIANEEIDSVIYPYINNLNAEFFVITVDVLIESGKSAYAIPYRSFGSRLRDIIYTNSNSLKRDLKYIEPEDAVLYISQTSVPTGFFVRNNEVVVVPEMVTFPNNGDTLRMFYGLRHSQLVSSSQTARVQNVNTTTGVVTLETALPNAVAGDYIDFIQANDRAYAKILDFDKVVADVNGVQLTFDPADIPADLTANDIVAFANETSVICLPDAAFMALVQAVCCRILESQADMQLLQAAQQRLVNKLTYLGNTLDPRIKGEERVVINWNGILNRSYSRFPRRRVTT